jgi:hypothetical protein
MDFRAELYARCGYRLDESLVGFFVVVVGVVAVADVNVFRRTFDSLRRTEKTPPATTRTATTKPAVATKNAVVTAIETTMEP